jgi:hypothetical protein
MSSSHELQNRRRAVDLANSSQRILFIVNRPTRLRLIVAAALVIILCFVGHFKPAAKTSAQGIDAGQDYLKLSPGKRWILRSSSTSQPIELRVEAGESGSYQLQFNNPWINSVLLLQPRGEKILLRALTMGGQTKPYSNPPVYFDFGLPEGQKWSNTIGTMTILSRHRTVQAGRTYQNCIEIKEVDTTGGQIFWTFAAGVGFVQFGEGKTAFVLDEKSSDLVGNAAGPAEPISEASRPETSPENSLRSPVITTGAWMALAANPSANESFDAKTVNARFEQSVHAGVSYVYLSPKWNELESRPGKYDFKDLDFQIGQAVQHGLPLICNVRIVDTNQRSMPADLDNRSFNDPQLRERLLSLFAAIMPRFQGHAKYILVGNEIDGYFKIHPAEVAGYRELYLAAATRVKELQPGTPVSTTITFDGMSVADSLLKPLMDATDFFSLTYYPLTPEFIVRDPDSVKSDFARMKAAAHHKKILLQEVGYPSSPLNKSSEEKQAALCRNVLAQLRTHKEDFIGAYWFTMCDFPDSIVQNLAKYYHLGDVDRFKGFLGSLGMFDQRGNPKKSWLVFSEEAPLLKH